MPSPAHTSVVINQNELDMFRVAYLRCIFAACFSSVQVIVVHHGLNIVNDIAPVRDVLLDEILHQFHCVQAWLR